MLSAIACGTRSSVSGKPNREAEPIIAGTDSNSVTDRTPSSEYPVIRPGIEMSAAMAYQSERGTECSVYKPTACQKAA